MSAPVIHKPLGNTTLITSRDTLGGIVNQVKREFNGLGQLIAEWQEHGGAVTGGTQVVLYAWSEMPSGANHSRLVSITYPDGYVLTFNYASGINDDISRLSHLSDTGGTLEAYDYLGSGTVVRRAHPQPGVDMTYIGSPGAGGDQYAGLDEFGRVVDLLWVETGGPTALEHIQHSYDLLGNRLTRDNLVNSAFDEVYAYDDLSQLVNFARGAHTQDWDYDALGNWNSVTTNGGTPETRTHDAQNQITSISSATTPTFDANGNMTGDETGRTFVYDAWHRLVEVKSGSTTLVSYRYDGLNRRIVRDDGTDVTDLYYSSNWQVLEERVNGNVYAHYVWSPVYVDAMILRDRDSTGNGILNERLYIVQDANFNIVALVNTSGNVVERYAYDPFGVRTVMDASWNGIGSSAYAFEHGFQGRPFDAVSGTNNFRNREYSATLGRPIQMDMLRFDSRDVNFYRWEGNGPTNRLDPTGLKDTPPSIAIDKEANDVCGPDVTEWFLKDLLSHAEALRKANKTMNDAEYVEEFRKTAKYYLSYKWMAFKGEGCGTGRGADTVMFAGLCIRKNQLGNIAFGFLASMTGVANDKMTVAIGYGLAANGTYDKNHPYSKNYGELAGAKRADNLAAFSLGAHIQGIPFREGLAFDKWVALIVSVIKDTGDELYNKYADLYSKGTKLSLAHLTFIPEYGGFDTRSCKPCLGKDGKPIKYDGPGSKAAFVKSGYMFSLMHGLSESQVDKSLRTDLEDYWNPSVPR